MAFRRERGREWLMPGSHSWAPGESTVSPIGKFGQLISWLWFRATGWRIAGTRPKLDKYVLIAAPHTSWWDVVYMLTAAALHGIPLSWVVKDAAARPPLGWLVRFLGGIPIDRKAPHGVVEQIADVFRERDRLMLNRTRNPPPSRTVALRRRDGPTPAPARTPWSCLAAHHRCGRARAPW